MSLFAEEEIVPHDRLKTATKKALQIETIIGARVSRMMTTQIVSIILGIPFSNDLHENVSDMIKELRT
jgi:hypothetical protein